MKVRNSVTYSLSALVLAAMLVAPALVVQASPNTLYYAGLDDSWGRTLEDDQAVVHEPGSALHGTANKVFFPGTQPGDGGRFLDARVSQSAANTNIFAGQLAGDVTGRPDLVFPGSVSATAWYGQWSDKNSDNVIDDVHDSLNDPADEFVWRGLSSGTNLAMALYVTPTTDGWITPPGCNCARLYALGDPTNDVTASYKDYTNTDEQSWLETGSGTWAVTPGMEDASLLYTMQHVTLAEAVVVKGAKLKYDLADPGALVDVDRYTGFNPDVENLYRSVMSDVKPEYDSLQDQLLEVNSVWIANRDAVYAVIFADQPAATERMIIPPFPKEPNHIEDDYNENAVFGGVGDTRGSYNSYEGYQAHPSFFIDARAVNSWHPTIDVDAGPGGHINQRLLANTEPRLAHQLPALGSAPHERQSPLLFSITASVIAWQDLNGDGYPGRVCDPTDVDAWDAERNTCRAEDRRGSSGGEGGIGLCSVSEKDPVRVEPLSGNWPGVLLVRDHEQYSSVIWNLNWEAAILDDRPLFLNWRPCGSSGILTRDVLVFPTGGLTIPVKTTMTATSGAWVDGHGVTHPAGETVRDVDVYYPAL